VTHEQQKKQATDYRDSTARISPRLDALRARQTKNCGSKAHQLGTWWCAVEQEPTG